MYRHIYSAHKKIGIFFDCILQLRRLGIQISYKVFEWFTTPSFTCLKSEVDYNKWLVTTEDMHLFKSY